ncbi:hypothetical protein KP509_10G053100 [Ceratopteris richardii]|uniref:Uncharacterized protein n=1 Tax=Ceratopteris richardii TaxID=49495 RepID=A0A8T2TVC6_CERRI|nr:hypothetical protein KP509_10G053100 [Ceratopteris richardii]
MHVSREGAPMIRVLIQGANTHNNYWLLLIQGANTVHIILQ